LLASKGGVKESAAFGANCHSDRGSKAVNDPTNT
jgi:hypothetical protein